jgi:hypothetical protein
MGRGRTCTYDTKGDIGMSYVKNKIEKKKNQTPKLNSRLQDIRQVFRSECYLCTFFIRDKPINLREI